MSAALMVGFVALLLIGVPIAFAMGVASLLAIIVHGGLPFSPVAGHSRSIATIEG